MDAISYSLAAKQAQRIKKFVAEPDSASGLVTVPSVIASGETVSIPAGRTLVHPNLRVEGTLAVDGTLFIPSGGSVSTTEVDSTVVKQNGSVVANDSAVVHKTGNETIAGVKTFSSNTIFNGNVGIGTGSPVSNLEVVGATNSAGIVSVRPNGTGALGVLSARNSSDTSNYSFGQIAARQTAITIDSSKSGTGAYLPMILGIGGGSTLMLDTNYNSLHVNPNGGLGYGTGAGGTVTQLTSKSTSVTLNKPCGQINMNGAALAAGSYAVFNLYNTVIGGDDVIIVQLKNGAYNYGYRVGISAMSAGACSIYVKNDTASSLAEPIMLTFTIIKGATA